MTKQQLKIVSDLLESLDDAGRVIVLSYLLATMPLSVIRDVAETTVKSEFRDSVKRNGANLSEVLADTVADAFDEILEGLQR